MSTTTLGGDITTVNPTLLDRLPVFATLLVALAVATLSFRSTSEMAEVTGAATGGYAYLVPFAVEGSALIFAVCGMRRSQVGLSVGFEYASFMATLLLAVAVTGSHVAGAWPGEGVVLSAGCPVLLALITHTLWRARAVPIERARLAQQAEDERLAREREDAAVALAQTQADLELARLANEREERAERTRERRSAAERERATTRVERGSVSAPTTPASAETSPTSANQDERLAQVAEWVSADPTLTGAVVGERLGVSPATGRRLLAAAREQVDARAA